MRIGLISDTHIPTASPDLWPQVYDALRGVDLGPADIDVRTTLWTDVDMDTWLLGATSGADQVV